ncbi:MAG: hypothetical protein LUF35_06380 [Lachnospiraceae bacterium]|nr:hypothetical protein [Lachnospiraceae bacterium]
METQQTKTKSAKRKWPGRILHFLVYIFILLVLLLYFSVQWGIANYGNIGMDEIVFTLSMSLEGTSQTFINSYLRSALLPTVVLFVLFFWSFMFPTGISTGL